MEQLRQNEGYALRILRRSPAFTVTAVVSLAQGIGANAAIFTLVNALLFVTSQVETGTACGAFRLLRDGKGIPFSYPMFKEVERGQHVFSDLIGWAWATFSVELNGVSSRNRILAVTGNYYSGLGVAPLFGRLLTSEDVNPQRGATSQVAVIGYQFVTGRLQASFMSNLGRGGPREGHGRKPTHSARIRIAVCMQTRACVQRCPPGAE